MEKIQTRLMKQRDFKPTLLDFSKVSFQRNLLKKPEDRQLLYSLERGMEGEQFVLRWLEEYGSEEWIVLPNLWMDYYGSYESDLLLLTPHGSYVFEVKNYDGHFEYKNNQCWINGHLSGNNCIHQAERAFINLRHICREVSPAIQVHGAILFVGEHHQVSIQSKVNDIQVIQRNQLRDFIQHIAKKDNEYQGELLEADRLIQKFEQFEITNPFPPRPFQEKEFKKVRKGIYCKKCGSYKTNSSKLFVKCPCGFTEKRKEAVLRTIHEYRTLTFDKSDMRTSDLLMFLDHQVSRSYLLDILNQHFDQIHSGSQTTFRVKRN